MASERALAVIQQAIGEAVVRAGTFGVRALPDTDERLALDIIDALESAGFRIEDDDRADSQ